MRTVQFQQRPFPRWAPVFFQRKKKFWPTQDSNPRPLRSGAGAHPTTPRAIFNIPGIARHKKKNKSSSIVQRFVNDTSMVERALSISELHASTSKKPNTGAQCPPPALGTFYLTSISIICDMRNFPREFRTPVPLQLHIPFLRLPFSRVHPSALPVIHPTFLSTQGGAKLGPNFLRAQARDRKQERIGGGGGHGPGSGGRCPRIAGRAPSSPCHHPSAQPSCRRVVLRPCCLT